VRVWRTIRLVAGGGMVVVLGAAAMMLWPLLWPPDPDASVQLVNGRLVGETSGYVGRIDRSAQTVDISSSLVGWRPIVLVVNEQTAILVQNRQGGFGDLLKDLPVRVSYEVVGERRMAKSIEVVTEESERGRAATNGSTGNAPTATAPAAAPASPPGAPARAPVEVTVPATRPALELPASSLRPTAEDMAPPTRRPADVSPPRPVAPVPSAKAPTPTHVMPPAPLAAPPAPAVAPPAPLAAPPAPVAKPPVPAAPPARVEPPTPRVSAPIITESPARVEPPAPRAPAPRATTEAPASTPAPRPAEGDSGDGAAAIDWLLKRGR
jgi:hypothetical protein